MPRSVWRLTLISGFGRNSESPLRTAWLKILSAFLGAAAFGTLLASSLWNTSLPTDIPTVFVATILTGLALVLSALLQLSFHSAIKAQGNRIPKLLITLPLGKKAQWLIKIVPMLILNLFLLAFCLPIVVSLSHAMHQPLLITAAALVAGSLSGVGYAVLNKPRNLFFKIILLSAIFVAEARLLERVLSHPNQLHSITSSMLCLNLFFIVGLISSFWAGTKPESSRSSKTLLLPKNPKVINSFWFVAKVLRNKRTQLSLLFCLFLTTTMTAFIQVRHLAIGSSELIFIMALLTAAFTSDIRGISRKCRTPEIVALRGVDFFVVSEVVGALFVSLIIGLPTYIWLAINSNNFWPVLAAGLSMQLAAVMVGLLFSSFLVPQAGDIGSQFFASLSSATLIFLLPKLISSNSTYMHQASAWLLAATLGCFLIYLIESQRRRSYGISTR